MDGSNGFDDPLPLWTPEEVCQRVSYLVNLTRQEYELDPLEFSAQLSFMAGEHACKMSIEHMPFGHDDFDSRHCQVVGALAFSENIGRIERCKDPAQELLVTWFSKATSFSRILSTFTHTGVGAAESEDGFWFIVQVFATFKPAMHRKDQMIVVSRLVNAIRCIAGRPPLSLSIIGCARLKLFCEQSRVDNPLAQVNNQNAKLFFEPCSSAKAIIEQVPAGPEHSICS